MKGRKYERLPPPIKAEFESLLASKQYTSQQISDKINRMLEEYEGETDVKSIDDNTVWREAKRIEEIAARVRESQEMASALSDQFDLNNLGEQGRLLMALLQSAHFKTTTSIMDQGDFIDPETLNELVLSMARLQRSANSNAELEKRIYDKAKRKAQEASAQAAEKVAKQAGASGDTINKIREAIAGVRL